MSTCLLVLVIGALLSSLVSAFRVTLDVNTYTSSELDFARSALAPLDGTWVLPINSAWNGSASTPSAVEWCVALLLIITLMLTLTRLGTAVHRRPRLLSGVRMRVCINVCIHVCVQA